MKQNLINIKNKYKNILYIGLWIMIFTSAILFYSWGLKHESIWYDESHTAAVINHSLTDIFKIASNDYHPPLYFIILKIYTIFFGKKIYTLRSFSLIGTMMFFILAVFPIRKTFGKKCSLIFSIFILIIPVFSNISQDARMYTWASFFVMSTAVYGYLILKKSKIIHWILFSIFTLASAYTHHYALAAVIFINFIIFGWLIYKKDKKIKPYIITAAILIILFIPWLFSLFSQIKQTTGNFWIPEITVNTFIDVLLYPYENKFTSYESFFSIIGFILIVIVIYMGIKNIIITKDKNGGLLFIAAGCYILTLFFTTVFSIIIKPILYPRYIISVVPLLLFCVSYTVSKIKEKTSFIIVISVFIFSCIPQNIYIRTNKINGPMNEAAEYVKKYNTKNTVFIHGDEQTVGTFMYHFPEYIHYYYLPDGYIMYSNTESFSDNLKIIKNFDNIDLNNKRIWIVNRKYAQMTVSKDLIYSYKLKNILNMKEFEIPESWYSIRVENYEIEPNTAKEKIIYTEKIKNSNYGSILKKDWWKSAVFYVCYIRAFQDSDNNGHGDIQGLIQRLDYLKELGITGICLLPVTKSMNYNNDFAVKDYRNIENEYGTIEDFNTLLKEAHKRKIGIITDMVINHSSTEHPFFKNTITNDNSEYKNWFIWNQFKPDEWQIPIKGNPWRMLKSNKYYYALYDESMPDWNYKNPNVLNYMNDNIRFWLNTGIDGFRLESVSFLVENSFRNWHNQPESIEYSENIRAIINNYKNKFTVCEAIPVPFYNRAPIDFIGNNRFHSEFSFGLNHNIINAVKNNKPSYLNKAIKEYISISPDNTVYSNYLSNHNFYNGARPYTQFEGDIDKCKLAASILLTIPGIPFIYYGEEIGMSSNPSLNKNISTKTPMQWTDELNAGFSKNTPFRKINNNYKEYNVQTEKQKKDSILNHYKKLISIRNSNTAMQNSSYEYIKNINKNIFAFSKENHEEKIIIILNFSNKQQNVKLNIRKTKTEKEIIDLLSNKKMTNTNDNIIKIKNFPAYGVKIYKIKNRYN